MAATKKTVQETNAFESMMAFNPESYKEGSEKFAEGVTTFTDFQKNYLEAVMASAGAFAKGVEKLTAEQTAFAKSSFEEGVAIAKAASSAKSLQESVDINSTYAREAIEKNLGQATKVADLWIETTKQTVEPLTVRYSELVEKIQSYRP